MEDIAAVTARHLPTPARITLKYWTPGPFAHAFCGDDLEKHERAGFQGLERCLDEGLLRHVPRFSDHADGYTPTRLGQAVISRLRRAGQGAG